MSSKTSRKSSKQIVTLPPAIVQVDIPSRLVSLLQMLMQKPMHTLDIRELGIMSSSQAISELKSLGAVIDSPRITAIDNYGVSHPNVSLYCYKGWVR